jgi:tetratricopeptide (TPR) repeat protein
MGATMRRHLIRPPVLILFLLLSGVSYALAADSFPSLQLDTPDEITAIRIRALKESSDALGKVDEILTSSLLAGGDRQRLWRRLQGKTSQFPVLLAQLDLALRSGHRQEARGLLESIVKTDQFTRYQMSAQLANKLVARHEWDLAEWMLLTFPTDHVDSAYAIENHIITTRGVAKADAFLQKLSDTGSYSWSIVLIRFRSQHGGLDALLKKLEKDIRDQPESVRCAQLYLTAAQLAGKQVDPSWVGDICKPKLAVESTTLRDALLSAGYPQAAVLLLKRSLATPITDQDKKLAPGGEPGAELTIRMSTRESLARAYQSLGKKDLAAVHTRIAEQLDREYEKVVEDDYLKHHATNTTSPPENGSIEYWLSVARICGEKHGIPHAWDAYEKALNLAETDASRQRSPKENVRLKVIEEYAFSLSEANRFDDATRTVRREMEQANQSDEERRDLLRILKTVYGQADRSFSADDELLWDVLSKNAQWEGTEQNCLRDMMQITYGPPAVTEKQTPRKIRVIQRAEALCQDTDPSRSAALAWLCAAYGCPERAIPLYKDAARRLSDRQTRSEASFHLVELYIKGGDAAGADQHLVEALHYRSLSSPPALIAQVAVLAAKSGDKERAMRLWKRLVNIDATFVLPVRELAQAGLIEELRSFYQEQEKLDPQSWVPAAMLDRLGKPLTAENWADLN